MPSSRPSGPDAGPDPSTSTSAVRATCLTLEIVDRTTGMVVSGSTQTRIVGQKIELMVRSNPTGHSITEIQWRVPGQRLKSYTQTVAAGAKTDLAAGDLQGTNLDFYWTDRGSHEVTVAAKIDGTPGTASVTCNVLRPTVDRFTITTSSVSVLLNHFASMGSPALGAYQPAPAPARYGCQWDAQVTAPADGAGEIGFTQKILVNRSWTNNAGVTRTYGSGVLVLDHALGIQYNGSRAIAASASSALNGSSYCDSPWIPLVATDRAASANERFELYLMYRPAGGDSIWVTLGKAPWSWQGQATRDGAPAATTNNWTVASGAGLTPSPSAYGADSTELPEWNGNFGTATWS